MHSNREHSVNFPPTIAGHNGVLAKRQRPNAFALGVSYCCTLLLSS